MFKPVIHIHSSMCVLRSLSVGIFISVDYWWTTNVTVRGLDEVSSMSCNWVKAGLINPAAATTLLM